MRLHLLILLTWLTFIWSATKLIFAPNTSSVGADGNVVSFIASGHTEMSRHSTRKTGLNHKYNLNGYEY